MSGPGPYGPGRRSEPREVPGGRREVPFGPDVSWPNGFRQLDPESRRLLESGYGRSVDPVTGAASIRLRATQYGRADPGYGSAGRGPGYRDPAADDYGDPGYSDPAYDGPRSGSGGRSWPDGNRGSRAPGGSPASDGSGYGSVPGYQVPDYRGPSRPDLGGFQQGFSAPGIYPVTGAQEALPATGPQPVADSWPGRDSGSARSGRPAYPEQWYDHPRLDDSRRGGARADSRPPAVRPAPGGHALRRAPLRRAARRRASVRRAARRRRVGQGTAPRRALVPPASVGSVRSVAASSGPARRPGPARPAARPAGTSGAATRAVPAGASSPRRASPAGASSPGRASRAATRRRSVTARAAMTGAAPPRAARG